MLSCQNQSLQGVETILRQVLALPLFLQYLKVPRWQLLQSVTGVNIPAPMETNITTIVKLAKVDGISPRSIFYLSSKYRSSKSCKMEASQFLLPKKWLKPKKCSFSRMSSVKKCNSKTLLCLHRSRITCKFRLKVVLWFIPPVFRRWPVFVDSLGRIVFFYLKMLG